MNGPFFFFFPPGKMEKKGPFGVWGEENFKIIEKIKKQIP